MTVVSAAQPIPPVLYKYYPPERLDLFDACTIRFSNPAEFNDVFDSKYEMPDKRLRGQHFKFRQSLGVICLTEDADNHLMWVHYAKQHKGFVVGFKTADPLFAEPTNLRPVLYRPVPASLISDVEPPLDICFYKSDEWSYEKEWRYVRRFSSGESRDSDLVFSAIATVILGSKMEEHHRLQVLQFVDAVQPEYQILVSESKPNVAKRTFEHTPTSMKICAHCSGLGYTRNKAQSV